MTGTIAPTTRFIEVTGCPIAYRSVGDLENPTLTLIHGGAAHSGWWARVAPRLADRYHVVTLDLSGHGDSGHRPIYRSQLWAEEVDAVLGAAHGGVSRPAAIVGHSMGGLVAVATAAQAPEVVSALVLLDTRLPLRELPPRTTPARFFASAQEALDRFRLLPSSTNADARLLEEVARAGLTSSHPGWRWKFDPAARRRLTNAEVRSNLAAVRCPVGYAYGARSDMGGPASVAVLEEWLGRPVGVATVPDAFHHVPLDQPAACAEAIHTLLGAGSR